MFSRRKIIMRGIFKFAILIFILFSCGNRDEVALKNLKDLSFEKFNIDIDSASIKKESWIYDPLQVISKYLASVSMPKIRNIDIRVINMGETPNEIIIQVKDQGILDDSIESEFRTISMKNFNGIWRLTELKKCWKCRQGRGDSNFDTIPCN